MTDDPFNLHALATEVIRTSESVEPGELAAQLIDAIPDGDRDEAMLVMARGYVRSVFHGMRSSAQGASHKSRGSAKVGAAREAWQRLIDVPEYVPSLDGWIRLREATRDQVIEMAQHRTAMAQKNRAAAKRYERIAQRMGQLKAATVGDLPADVLETEFTGSAAT